MKRLRKMLFGEKIPDKEDPQYKARYERDVEAGKKFCRATRLDKCAAGVQKFATLHTMLFFSLVLLIILCCFTFSIRRMTMACRYRNSARTGTVIQDSLLGISPADTISNPLEKEEQ